MNAPITLYETLHGSRAYGLAREGSDWDYKGVIVGPPSWYFGFKAAPEQLEYGPDHVLYELRKFVRLAAGCNPSIIEVLFTHEDDHTTLTSAGRRLLEARRVFLSKRVEKAFAGYAESQLGRIRTHRAWLLSPPDKPPIRADFGLPEKPTVSRDQLGAYEALEGLDVTPQGDVNFIRLLDQEKRFRAAKRTWDQYRSWVEHRNPKRAALEAASGYDTKHALHLIRLLRMSCEILETGEVHVRRPDREELLAIRDGIWSYDELMVQAEALSARSQEAARASALPDAPDEEALETLCVSLIEEVLAARATC